MGNSKSSNNPKENIYYDHKTTEEKWLGIWERTLYKKDNSYTKAEQSETAQSIEIVNKPIKPNYFAMDTFAYPSAKGVHIGYVESFGATDMIARFHRMKGYNVFYPMGYDTFGLPAENYAIKTGIHPKDNTEASIENFKKQYRKFGLSFDAETGLNTADVKYYRWTQWIFLKLYEKGLAYRANKEVGYCESCKTVISKEQTIEGGYCERCGSPILTKKITQWYFKITEYQERLYAGIDGLEWPESGKKIEKQWIGKLHDWCISRQRYWGTPIPIVYCDKCGEQPVPFDKLPVELPYDVDFIPTGEAPLKKNKEFYEGGTCPKCSGPAKREVDVMDTFVSSAWYMYRYFDMENTNEPFDPKIVNKWFPMDWYQGAEEHYTAHLIYARFIAMFLHDIGYLNFEEPITKYISCGMVVASDGGKFSKRLANAPDLELAIEQYGADTLRMYLQSVAPFEEDVPWNTAAIPGIQRLINKIYRIGKTKVVTNMQNDVKVYEIPENIIVAFNRAIDQIESSFKMYNWNVAISRIIDLTNEFNKAETVDAKIWKEFIKMIAPFAPFIAEEMWNLAGGKGSIHEQSFPERISDSENAEVKQIEIVISVNGKKRASIYVSSTDSENEMEIVSKAQVIVEKNGVTKDSKYKYIKGKIINFIFE